MSFAIPWLPDSALCDARTTAPVAQAVADWGATWLATDGVVVPPRWEHARTTAPASEAFALHVPEGGKRALAALLLGRETYGGERYTASDELVLEHLVDAALAALRAVLEDTLTGAANARSEERYSLPITASDGSLLFRIDAPRSALVALVVGWAGPRRPELRLGSLSNSLATQPLHLAARVGANRLALADIEALEVGDVLTLDTAVSAPVAACIDGKLASDEALLLTLEDGTLRLKIERPATQW